MASVTLKNVYKVYDGGVTAVTDFNLEIADKEFIILVGPGCGKIYYAENDCRLGRNQQGRTVHRR